MLKRVAVLALVLFFFGVSSLMGQEIAITRVDPGPYTPGSTIGVLFTISAATNLRPNNVFTLYLSDASGSFAAEKNIGTFSGLYSSFVNGVIPGGTVVGTGYKVRIKSSNPGVTSAPSADFQIGTGTAVIAKVTNGNLFDPVKQELFGFCSGRNNFNFNLGNESTPGAVVSALITNELTGVVAPIINFNASVKTFTAQQAHYTVFVTAVNGGNLATKAYMIVNNRAITAFGTAGTNNVCLGGEALEFNVLVNGADGIINNYPGTTYKVDWGDNTNNVYTLKDISGNDNKVGHDYLETACGNQIDLGSTTVYNAFGISIFAQNQYCGTVGTPISTFAKVSKRPANRFTVPSTLCANADAVFINTSDSGENPDANAPGCVPNTATFTWYVDGDVVPGAIDKPKSFQLSYRFAPGNHTVTIESTSNSACPPSPVTKSLCIQRPAQPSFTLNGSSAGISICNTGMLTPLNTSVVDDTSCGKNTYTWSILPASYTLMAGSSLNTAVPPQIKFTNPGAYKIKLTINASQCGEVSTPEQTVLVSASPTAVLSPDIVLCNYGTYDFNGTTGPTQTVLSGTPDAAVLPDTYTWEVTGGLADFVNGTTIHSKFPRIQFNEFKVYTIKITHLNGCSTVSDTQVVEFRASPIVNAGTYPDICFGSSVALNASLVTGYNPSWVGGEGTFSPDRNSPSAVYMPSDAEQAAGHADLRWQITTTLAAPCNVVYDIASISIKARNTITSAGGISICSGTSVNYTPLSTVAESSFTWTATATAGVTGFTAIGSGAKINDVIINQNATANATVTYHITPASELCTGDPFDLVVTVTPNPIVTASAAKLSICTGETALINVSNNLPASYDVKYTYTSTASAAGITGNTSNTGIPAALTAVSDVLVNAGPSAGTVIYQIAAISSTGCTGSVKTIVITVNPQGTIANAGADETICSNIAYPLQANIPEGTSTGKWTLQSGTPVTFADATKYNTTVSGLTGGETYTFRWTITTGAGCFTYDDVIITNLPQLGNINITGTADPVCQGDEVTLTGEIPTGGDGNYTYTWQSSINDGATWQLMPGEIGRDLVVNINATTSYQRITKGGICVLVSNALKVVMLQPLANNIISADQSVCVGSSVNALTGSMPTGGDGVYLYQWQTSNDAGASWIDVPGATADSFTPPIADATILYRRIAKTTVCTGYAELPSNVVTITAKPHAKAEFTVVNSEDCAPFAIDAFNIRAVPYSDRNATYTWYASTGSGTDVLIGTGINFPGYTIQTEDTFVAIKLVVTSSRDCNMDQIVHTFNTVKNVHASYTQDRTAGCGPLLINFTNTSNITEGVVFKWDFGNGQTSTDANPGVVSFAADPTGKEKIYVVTLNAVTSCGSSQEFTSTVTIHTAPVSIFSPGSTVGCSPLSVTFVNTSPESAGTTYTYDWGDGTAAQTYTDRADVVHTFSAVGTTTLYTIKMTASNECGTHTSQHTISVVPNNIFAELVVDANDKQGCAPLLVHFSNNSGNAISYIYDFGDGTTQTSTTSPEKITHTFTQPGTYIVKLTAMNNCITTTTTETITVFEQPATRFTVDKTLGYPGLKFQFTNGTVGGIKYLWNFGDGSTSMETNPSHVYQQVGNFKVTLRASNVADCASYYNIDVIVNGEPGSLYVPNSFIPASDDPQFKEFKAKGTGIASWRMIIFDKWGAVLWETTKLDDGKPVDGWDGTYKGQKMPQGVYFWKINLELRNGLQWKGVTLNSTAPKRTGTINLIR